MKILLLSGLLAAVAAPASAHDFWIQPSRFQIDDGATVTAIFQVGHGKDRQRWGNDIRRIPLLIDVSPTGRRNQRTKVQSGQNADFVSRLGGPGIHVLAMQTATAFSELPALRFNDYIKAEGLALPIAARARSNTNQLPGRERYTRRAKALIQVGTQTAANTILATRPIGMKLEIVPEINPYMLGRTRRLPVYVLYKGKRLPNATVRLTSLEFDARPLEREITNRAGRATFTVPAVGDWLINVIWSEPVSGDRKVDFETTFSSLTFGYDPATRSR